MNTKKAKESDGLKNRIVRWGEQRAVDFLSNPSNWRIHPSAQRGVLRDVLSDIGWVTGVIVNKTTGHVIDGHARIEEALKLGDEVLVPFVEVELSEDEEKVILATFDPIGAMAAVDKEQLDALLRDVNTSSASIQAMLSELASKNGIGPVPDFKEYDESVADEVEMITCPHCGKTFPK